MNRWINCVWLSVAGMDSLCPIPEEEPLPSPERRQLSAVLANSRQFTAEQPVSIIDFIPASVRTTSTPPPPTFSSLRLLTFGSAVEVTGVLKESPHQRQQVELEADQISVVGKCNPMVRLGFSSFPLAAGM